MRGHPPAFVSAMRQAVGHRSDRRADVHVGCHALELVMSSLVKKVADPHDAAGFESKVSRQTGSAPRKNSGDGIEFPAAAGKVRSGDEKVGGCPPSRDRKQGAVLSIPEAVRSRFMAWRWHLNRTDREHPIGERLPRFGRHRGIGSRGQFCRGRNIYYGKRARRLKSGDRRFLCAQPHRQRQHHSQNREGPNHSAIDRFRHQ